MPGRQITNVASLIGSVPTLDGSPLAFPAWRTRLLDVLALQGVADIVSGELQRPDAEPSRLGDANGYSPEHSARDWDFLSDMACLTIRLTLSVQLAMHHENIKPAPRLWEVICAAYDEDASTRQAQRQATLGHPAHDPAKPTEKPEKGVVLGTHAASPIASAAAARRQKLPAPSGSDKAAYETRQTFLHLIERELVERNSKAIVLAALDTLEKITNNILKNPSEAKFKMVKHSNALIKKNIIDVPGARDYLLACKFVPGVKEHVETLNFPVRPSKRQLGILAVGHEIIIKKIRDIKASHETEISMKQKEEDAEKRRATVALIDFREDRERQKVRSIREQMARSAKERQAQIELDKSYEPGSS